MEIGAMQDGLFIELIIYKRPNMFAVHWAYGKDVGTYDLEQMFTNPDFKAGQDKLVLYYPERFLNIIEQRALFGRIKDVGYKSCYIVSHSVYLIQTVHSKCIGVVDDDDIPEGTKEFKLSNDEVGLHTGGGIQVFGGSIENFEDETA